MTSSLRSPGTSASKKDISKPGEGPARYEPSREVSEAVKVAIA